MVLGPDLGLQLSERENIAAQLVLRTDTGVEVVRTPAYEAYLNAH